MLSTVPAKLIFLLVGAFLLLPALYLDARVFQYSRPSGKALFANISEDPKAALWSVTYVAIYVMLCISIVVSPLVTRDWLRRIFGINVAVNATAFVMYCHLTEMHKVTQNIHWNIIDTSLFETLWAERSMLRLVAPSYYMETVAGLLIFGCIAYVMCARPVGRWAVTGPVSWLPIGALAASIVAALSTGGGMVSFPSSTSLLNGAAIKLALAPSVDTYERLPPNIRIGAASPFKNIVLLMDESVSSEFIWPAAQTQKVTPFLASNPSALIDFGEAVSAHNCSIYSRFIMRYGIRPWALPDKLVRSLGHSGPTFWQFASKAGYETVHINGMARLSPLQGGGIREAAEINRTIDINPAEFHARDGEVLSRLIENLKTPGRKFIFAEKFGVHFPYEFTYPDREAFFDVGGSVDLNTRRMNHYKNGIRWSVDKFLAKLISEVDLDQTLIIYTSDHGQKFGTSVTLRPHCSTGPGVDRVEAAVPMMVAAGDSTWAREFSEAAARSKGATSHFQIFPTLLMSMGYEPAEVIRLYGPSLLGHPPVRRQFLVGSGESLRWIGAD